MSARRFNYFDDYKSPILECPKCDWRGTFEQGSVEYYAELMDTSCPKCDVIGAPMLAIVSYPTLEEARANIDRPGIREWVERIDRGFDEFEAQKLREPGQLPEIDERSFTLVWDFEAGEGSAMSHTLIKHRDTVIFTEPARYEEYRRFGEVAEILKGKYGDRIHDLVPTEKSDWWLYGDSAEGEAFVEWYRAHFFGANVANLKQEPYSPFLTSRFDLAFQFASGVHHQQARKGTRIPYIAHLMSVCALVLEAGGDEDQAIAALLHDGVEDQGGLPTLDRIRQLFGTRVADAVVACSDSTPNDPRNKLPWRERKEKYLEHLRNANADALLIAAADKLHNARATLSDYRALGENVWARFNAPKADQLWFYGAMVETLRETDAPKAIVGDLGIVVDELNRPQLGHQGVSKQPE